MKRLTEALGVLLEWPARRWAVTVGAAIAFAFTIAIPTALIPNPIFGRKIPPTWWSRPARIVRPVRGGLLVATHVRDPAHDDGALTWFEPIQPVLQAVAIALLAWAVIARLEGERFCPLPSRVDSGNPWPDAR